MPAGSGTHARTPLEEATRLAIRDSTDATKSHNDQEGLVTEEGNLSDTGPPSERDWQKSFNPLHGNLLGRIGYDVKTMLSPKWSCTSRIIRHYEQMQEEKLSFGGGVDTEDADGAESDNDAKQAGFMTALTCNLTFSCDVVDKETVCRVEQAMESGCSEGWFS